MPPVPSAPRAVARPADDAPLLRIPRLGVEIRTRVASSPTWPPADPAAIVALGERYDTFGV